MFIIPVTSCVCERETVAKRILQITREAIQVNHQCNQCVSNLALITSMQLYNNNNNKASNLKYLCSYIKYYSKPGMKPVSATDQKAKNDGCSFYINCLYILSHNMVCNNLCQNKTSKKQIVLNREIAFFFLLRDFCSLCNFISLHCTFENFVFNKIC
jgi:hypothetical protein